MAARLRRGLFWYYLEPVEQPPEILPEYSYPLTGMHRKEMRRCALKAKCPIVPMAFIDSFRVLDEKGSDRVAVQLHYLPVIEYEEFKDMKTVELAALVKERIAACMADHNK